jgi:NAD(P)-dependent dehydrogenase (short-subunit alcohol dehydrogenase family)
MIAMQLDASIAAIVTGGASGLGAATAQRLAGHGVKVALFDLNAELGQQIAGEIGGVFCRVDVTSEAEVDAGFVRSRALIGQERILVNCAGTGNAYKTAGRDRESGEIRHFPLDAFERIIQINLIGTFRCIAKSAAGMLTLPPLDDGERVVARGAPPALADLTEPSLFGRSSSGSSSTRIGLRSKYGAARCWPETFRQTPRTIQTAARSSSRPPSISSGVASQAKSWCPGCRSKTKPRTVIRR